MESAGWNPDGFDGSDSYDSLDDHNSLDNHDGYDSHDNHDNHDNHESYNGYDSHDGHNSYILWWGGGQVQVRYEAYRRRDQDDRRDREGSLTS